MDQILQRGRSAPLTHNRSFSLTLNQTQNNPLVRKEEPSLSPGLSVTSARLVYKINWNFKACYLYYDIDRMADSFFSSRTEPAFKFSGSRGSATATATVQQESISE